MVPAAIEMALIRHEGHFRRGGRVPYIVHPLRVYSTLALRLGIRDEAILCAAILHDTIEDTRTDFDEIAHRFSSEVAVLVAALSKDTRLPEEERESRFVQQLAAAPMKALIVKLADNYDNLTDRLREGDAKEVRRSALQKKPQIDLICEKLPAEYSWFCEEVKSLLARCLAGA